MRAICTVSITSLALFGCGGGSNAGDTDTATPPVSFVLKDSVPAKRIEATPDQATLARHAVGSGLASALTLVAADAAVGTLMDSHTSDARDGHCWVAPDLPLTSFLIDYTPCYDEFGFKGGAFINQDPFGPLGIGMSRIEIDDVRMVDGAVGMINEDAGGVSWRVYDADVDIPIEKERFPITVTEAGREYLVSFEGGARRRGSVQTNMFDLWGVASITDKFATTTGTKTSESDVVVLGAATDTGNLFTDAAPADALGTTLEWSECRCATEGLMSQMVTLEIEEVRFDLDKLTTEEDEVDDPELDIEVGGQVTAWATIAASGTCGSWIPSWTPGEQSVEISNETLRNAVQDGCNSQAISPVERCNAFKAAVDVLAGPITVTLSEAKLADALSDAVDVDFDNTICFP